MAYELKSYLKAINQTKEPLMDGEDEEWERKYVPFIVNKCVGAFPDTIMLVNEINQLPNLDITNWRCFPQRKETLSVMSYSA
jgi:hypothetical protein